MNKRLLLLGTIITTISLINTSANAEGVYLGLGGGINFPSDTNIEATNASTSVDIESGWVAKTFVGYDFGNNWKTELEAAHRSNSNDRSNNADGIGDFKVWSAMGNVVYDINLDMPVMPFIGLGVGYAWFDPDNVSPLNGGHGILSDNSGDLAYQAFAGAAYNIYNNVDATLEYRYFLTNNQDGKTSNGFSVDSDYKSHDVLLGLRWNLGKPVVKKAENKNVVAPVVKNTENKNLALIPSNYLVFFDFDKADVTTSAKDIIKSASKSIENNNLTIIEITGHTDSAGSEKYNEELSRRRARSVMAELASQGISESNMEVYAKGETKPLIKTADGIKEPQNRRVEIIIK